MNNEGDNRTKGKLKLSSSKLNTLLEITTAINDNSSSSILFNILKKVLFDELKIGKFVLFTFDPNWRISLNVGISMKIASQVNIDYLIENYPHIDVLSSAKDQSVEAFDIVIPVFHKQSPLAYLLLADLEEDRLEISPIIKHLRFIQTLANIIVVALENKRLNKEHIQQIEVKKELELAQKMQSLLFPQHLPNSNLLKIKAFYKPNSEVGGDFYDVLDLGDERTAICIADVSGKGMSAALLMANFQANLRALLPLKNSLQDLIKAGNQKIIEAAKFEKFITLFIAIYDAKDKTLNYLNAGHQPAILIQNGKAIFLEKGCTVLGMFEELPKIETEQIQLKGGEQLYCYTDGLSELNISNEQQIETEGLANFLKQEKTIDEGMKKVVQLIGQLEPNSEIRDDITLLAAHFLP